MKHLLQLCLCAGLAAPVLAGSQADRDVVDQMTRMGLLLPSQTMNVELTERTTCFSGMIAAGTTVAITFVLTEDCCDYLFDTCPSDETDTYITSLIGPGINLVGADDPYTCPRDCASYSPSLLSPAWGYDNNTGGPPPACLPAGVYTLTLYSFSSYDPATCQYVDPGPFTLCINCNVGGNVGTDDQPSAFALAQNTPNPFNPSTTINYTMGETGTASLKVFDIAGREVATLVSGMVERGEHSVTFDASRLSTGVYFYTLQAGGQNLTRKMVLSR
jgi:hypothetical protein